MNDRDSLRNARVSTALASVAITADEVQEGVAIDISKAVAIAIILECTAHTTGDIQVQDIQFADDSSFTQNVETITSDDFLLKNDRSSSDSAVDQTNLAAVGRSRISLENRAVNDQKYMRIRTISANSADLTANAIAIIKEGEGVVVQA